MNYGINEDYPASRGNNLLCPGGGQVDPDGGYILFDNPNGFNSVPVPDNEFSVEDRDIFVGFIGLNNGDGTGSLDSWFYIIRNAQSVIEFP